MSRKTPLACWLNIQAIRQLHLKPSRITTCKPYGYGLLNEPLKTEYMKTQNPHKLTHDYTDANG